MHPPPKQVGFLRTYALPAFWLFALPALGLWFADHARQRFDDRFAEAVIPEVEEDARLSPQERAEALRFYAANPPSVVCADQGPALSAFRESLGDACADLRQFAVLRGLSLGSLALGAGSLLFMLACALSAFASRPLQYFSFLVGWNVLRVVGAVQTLLQGTILVLLSFWMTALWIERYSPKLILVIAVLAAVAAYKVVRAIFDKPQGGVEVEGELIAEADAPALWARIRALCNALETPPPAQLVAGIDDNFFVTEGEVRVGDARLTGRTLYVSLALLRILSRSEADAVLAHEMAHLSGGDTRHGKRLSPLLARFQQYLGALHEGLITRPIFHFMLAYWGLFALSLGRANRERELSADAVAARQTSPSDVASSLLKIGAYASYRGRVEEALFDKDERHGELGIAGRVAAGFASYAGTEAVHFDLVGAVTPHPFDSHPPLRERLKNVGVSLPEAQLASVLLAPSASSWTDAIGTAAAIEQRLWTAYEARFAAAHELALAYRYLPANDAERAHVERFFPRLEFAGKGDAPGVALDYEKLVHAAWEAPLPLDQVASAEVNERMFKKYLDLKLKGGGPFRGKRSICLNKLADADRMVEAFGRYHGRHCTMVAQQALRAAS